MPVYEPKDYEEVLTRIEKKVLAKGIEMGSCLLEEEIAQFERKYNMRLPRAYRMFLKCIGDGCPMIDRFRLRSLTETKPENPTLPFMLEDVWIWEDDKRDEQIISEELETKVYRGNLELIDIGCGMTYRLIVSGKLRGEVWNFVDVGVAPCCERQDFLGWFELWVDYQENVDYHKDYVYKGD